MKTECLNVSFSEQTQYVVVVIVELLRIRKLVLSGNGDPRMIEERIAAYQHLVGGNRFPLAEAVVGKLEALHHINMGRPAAAIRCLEYRVLPAYEEAGMGVLRARALRLMRRIEADTVHP